MLSTAKTTLPAETLVDQVETRLREDIINGVWPAGARLGVEELRCRYATGATPIREALSRLYAEGIVAMVQNRGFRVPPMTREDLLDISRTRAVIEAAAARDSVEHGDDQWEAQLVAAFHLLDRRAAGDLVDPMVLQAYYEAHHAFHIALLAACRAPRLMRLQERLELQHSRYYRRLPLGKVEGEEIDEHRRLLRFAIDRDGPAIAAALGEHVMLTSRRLDLQLLE
jgi:DNA-binding GntR family transcriptional regulator